MKREMMKVLLYLKKSSIDKSGRAPIMGRITYAGTMAQFGSKFSCPPDLWNPRESRLRGKSREAVVTNEKLDDLMLAISQAYRTLADRGAAFTAADIKERLQGNAHSRTTFLERYDRLLEEVDARVGVDLTRHSALKYHQARKHFANFMQSRFGREDMTFGEMTEDFFPQFERYIKGELGLSDEVFVKLTGLLKKVCRLAYREGLSDRPLFEGICIRHEKRSAPRSLDRTAFDRLLALTFPPHQKDLAIARDLFAFTCYTGAAYCDMVRITRSHLFRDDRGDLWLKFKRQKTESLCRVKLLPEAVALIERYRSDEREALFSPIPYYTYLIRLKAVGLKAGLAFPLTAHIGRHTFATLITLENGAPIETVSRMLGHGSLKMTERYARVTSRKLFEEFDRFLAFTQDLRLTL